MLYRLVLPLALALALVLAGGCVEVVEEETASGPEAGSPSGEKTQLSLYTWTKADEAEANQALIEEFEQANPGISVELQNEAGSQGAMAKLQTLISGNEAPDLVSLHGAFYIPLASKGALLDIEPFIDRSTGVSLDDFDPRLVELCRCEGRLYSLPRYTSVYTLFYNQDLFDNAGVPHPTEQEPWDWDAYLSTAKKLTRDLDGDGETDTWGCAIDFWGARMYPWLWANGADIFSEDRTRCTLDSPEAIEAVQFAADLLHVHHVTPETLSSEHDQGLEMFTQGSIAMHMTGPWDVQHMRAAAESQGLKWAVAPLPSRKRRATMLGTENYAICSQTEHAEDAWRLFEFLMSPRAQEYMAQTQEKMPSRLSVINGSYVEADVGYDRRVFAEALSYAVEPPNVPDWAQVSPYYQEELDNIWIGRKTAAEGCRDAARRINEYRAAQGS